MNIQLYEKAVSNKCGSEIFNLGRSSTTGSFNDLDFDKLTLKKETRSREITVSVIGINKILNNHKSIKLLKLDCEGAEYKILSGITVNNLLKIKYLYIEAHIVKNNFPRDIPSIIENIAPNIFQYKLKNVNENCFEYVFKQIKDSD